MPSITSPVSAMMTATSGCQRDVWNIRGVMTCLLVYLSAAAALGGHTHAFKCIALPLLHGIGIVCIPSQCLNTMST